MARKASTRAYMIGASEIPLHSLYQKKLDLKKRQGEDEPYFARMNKSASLIFDLRS